jgi:hypothetical protein
MIASRERQRPAHFNCLGPAVGPQHIAEKGLFCGRLLDLTERSPAGPSTAAELVR